ncbi:prolyl-tRNA synthetase associated domain-containing protein [Limosilactobacillus sp.]|uniref:prolyl-tRNA synthetase associated domain-containing protein n=1 Tax=Limosilactobacillus sp. TaxID=2773925 RepID=UPI003F02B26B
MENKIISLLKKSGIDYQVVRHPAVYTAAEADKYVTGYHFARAKNLFLQSKQGFFLVMLQDNQRLDFHYLRDQLATTRLSFARSSDLDQQLGVRTGAVSPFNLINDQQHQVTLVVSRELLASDPLVGCHPNDNTMTVILKFTDLLKIVQQWGNPVRLVSLTPTA